MPQKGIEGGRRWTELAGWVGTRSQAAAAGRDAGHAAKPSRLGFVQVGGRGGGRPVGSSKSGLAAKAGNKAKAPGELGQAPGRLRPSLQYLLQCLKEMGLTPQAAARAAWGLSPPMDVLIDLWKKPRGTFSFTKDHVKAVIFSTFVAGIDTSAATIVWAMSELVRKPRVLKKVQDHIRAVVGGNKRVEPEDMPKLSYLRMVVKETLRLHPAAPLLLPRETMRDIQIGGYDVPAKTRIYVNAWAIGRDPISWSNDPDEFNPDRFEVNDIDFKGEHPELMPFGAGRRICPGISMAMATIEFTLANLLFSFEWALPTSRKRPISPGSRGPLVPVLEPGQTIRD